MQKLKYENFCHLSESVLKRLAQNHIRTILEFLEEDVSKLTAITNLSLPQVLAARTEIFTKYSAPIINGSTILTRCLERRLKISTGIESLDMITDGGIPTGYITELCGLADSGKTQLLFHLAINCVKDAENTVLYVDTKGDFSAFRVQKILEAKGYSHKDMAVIMYKIRVVHIWIMEELIDLLKSLKDKTLVIENLTLVIIDSIPCLMFQYLGDENKIGLSFLNTFVNYSRYLGNELNVGIVCVNILTRWVGSDISDLEDNGEITAAFKESSFVEKTNRCLGRYWQEIPKLILQIKKVDDSKENNCAHVKVSVMKSSNVKLENCQCNLSIGTIGII